MFYCVVFGLLFGRKPATIAAMKPTTTITDTSKQPRGSREIWLGAAKQTLLDKGVDAVKIQPLASALKLSRTSFYWFFKDRDALLEALLEEWENKNTGAIVDACEAFAETVSEAVLNLIAVFIAQEAFEPQLDFAIRGWAHQSPAITSYVNAADERRLDAIRQMFLRFGVAKDEADARARTVYLTQIGYIAMQIKESKKTRIARVPAYVKTFAGVEPTSGELARFKATLKAAD